METAIDNGPQWHIYKIVCAMYFCLESRDEIHMQMHMTVWYACSR